MCAMYVHCLACSQDSTCPGTASDSWFMLSLSAYLAILIYSMNTQPVTYCRNTIHCSMDSNVMGLTHTDTYACEVQSRAYSGTCLQQPPVGQLQLAFIERWLHYRGRLQSFSAMLVPFGIREAGCFREVAFLHGDHFRWVSL